MHARSREFHSVQPFHDNHTAGSSTSHIDETPTKSGERRENSGARGIAQRSQQVCVATFCTKQRCF